MRVALVNPPWDFAGSIYSANLDGSDKKNFLYAQGNLTGIAYAEMPSKEN